MADSLGIADSLKYVGITDSPDIAESTDIADS